MANSLLTISMITREAVRLFKNTNAFIQNIDTQYDDSYAVRGAKIGSQLRIRLPNDYTVTYGPAVSVQDTAEQQTILTMATQVHVDVSFTSVDRTLSLDDFSKRVLAPMVNNLAGAVALNVMQGTEGGVANFVGNLDGGLNVLTPTSAQFLGAGASLDNNSGPTMNRKIVDDPVTEARVVDSLKGLFNPVPTISKQYLGAKMYDALGFIWFKDQTVIKHKTGGAGQSSLTVSGANQTGLTIVTAALPGSLNVGDIVTIAGVNQVNRVTKGDLGTLRQFVITASAAVNATSISIYPALIPCASLALQAPLPYTPAQYQTVDYSPADGAFINPVSAANQTYRKNIAYVPEAVTLATADLEMPDRGVQESARARYDGVSMRMITQYVISTDQWITRLDVLFGSLWVRPEWAVVIPDVVP